MAVEHLTPLPLGSVPQIHQYKLVRSLGAGGMGVVYEAFHLRLQRRVALKVLSPHLAMEPDAVDRFEREMAAIGQLSHPNIVQALDAGADGSTHYLVMEYVDGANVEVVCRQEGELRIDDACEIIRQAALGLAHAHSFGIVHRDVKPSNLLLSTSGQVKIADLGLARFHSPTDQHSFTAVGDILGSYDYMSPEQATGVKVGPASDIYSLGATLFRLLAKTPVFSGPRFASPIDKMVAHQHEAPPRLSEVRPDIPDELDELVQRMLAKNPDERPGSIAEITDVLGRHAQQAALSGLVVPGTPATAGEVTTQTMYSGRTMPMRMLPVGKWSPARRGVAVAVGIAAVGLLLLLSAAFVAKRSPAERPVVRPSRPPPEFPVRFADLSSEELKLRKWYSLQDGEPERVIWPFDALSSVHLDPAAQSLTASCADLGVLSFGRIELPSYRLRLDVHQNHWSGGAGILLGLRPHPEMKGGYQAHGLVFEAPMRPGRKSTMNMRRGQFEFTPLDDGDYRLRLTNRSAIPISLPAGPIQPLEIEVSYGRLTHLRWGNSALVDLCTDAINSQFSEDDYKGAVGLYLLESDVTVSGMELMPLFR